MSLLTKWAGLRRLRTPVLIGLVSAVALYAIGLAVVNFQALAYKLLQLTIVIGFVHFMRKELFPYHDMKTCSDLRALGMFIFMGLIVIAFMVGL